MKPRSLILTLTLGLMAGLFACQDGGVVAPDDLQPQFAKGGKKPSDSPPVGATLVEFLSGFAETGWSWDYKKDVFRANGPMEVTTGSVTVGDCEVSPKGAEADHLLDALVGLTGTTAILRVDMASAGDPGQQGQPSEVNRITSYVGGEVVRYFWIGPLGEFASQFEDSGVTDATVSDFDDDWDGNGEITYTISGGILGVRDTESPKKAVKIACLYSGNVTVTVSKIEN